MRGSFVAPLLAAVFLLISSPADAQRYFSPYAGYAYGEAAGDCPSLWDECPNRRTGYGVAFGGLSGGVMGLEQDISWTPDFFGEADGIESSSVLTVMSNLVVGLPIGPLRPYAAFGIGLMKAKAEFTTESLTSFSDTSFGYDYGVGVMVLLPAHLGLRVDFRRFRSSAGLPAIGLDLPDDTKLRFSRASIGLVLH
ncbi:MAG TPA: outer membrane beta-barrel protein [Vicinamibacterales bacterium]|nr:outer membrane beta-barrel protein [Vicinamibacterales bacterium]